MPSLLDDPEAYAFAAQVAEDRRRKLTNQQALNAILQGVGDLPYTLLGAPVEISTGLLRAGGMAQGEQVGGIDYIKRKATELGIRPPDSSDPTMRDMRMGAEIVSGAIDPTRVARAGGAVAGAVAREAKPIVGNALENYMAKSGLAPRVVPENGLLGGSAFDVSRVDASDIFGAGAQKTVYKDPDSGGYIQVLTRPDYPASVLGLEVPEAFRRQGIGGRLQEQAIKDFPNMQGQVSSKAAARSAYKLGRRPVGKPDASLEDVFKMIDDDSSVNLVSPARQKEISETQGGLLDTDYRGSHKAPGPDFGAPLHDLTGGGDFYPADVYSPKATQYYGTGFPKADKEAFDLAKKVRGNPDAEVTMYRAVPKDAKDINIGDWVTLSKDYAKTHGESVLGKDYKIIEKKVKAKDLYTNADSIHEFGYYPNQVVSRGGLL